MNRLVGVIVVWGSLLFACGGEGGGSSVGTEGDTDPSSGSAGTQGEESADTGADASDADTGTDDAGTSDTGDADSDSGEPGDHCDIDLAAPPWPQWVPPWPGQGRNAIGEIDLRFLDDDPTIVDLRVEQLGPQSAMVAWETVGDSDATVAWGTDAEPCAWGHHRTGARREHRMLLAPLQPETEYAVTVRSRDDESEDWGELVLTTPAPDAATSIDACTVITEPGTYRVTADLQGDCTCLDVQADGVELDLGWHTITYAATETEDQCHGVYVEGDDVVVGRGIVVQGDAGGGLYSHAVSGRGSTGLTFEQMWIHVSASDAWGVQTLYTAEVTVRDLLIVSGVTEVTDRHYPGNRGIGLGLSPADATADVHDNVLFDNPHWGITIATDEERLTAPANPSTVTRRVYNNHVFANMTATNGYAINVSANHVEVNHNEVRPRWNGRGLHYTGSDADIHHNIIAGVERIHGDPADGYVDYSDIDDPASPHDLGVCSWVVAHTIRVESGNYGRIHHNEVYAYGLDGVTFGATGLNITSSGGASAAGNEIYENQFVAHRPEAPAPCGGGGLPTRAGTVTGSDPDEPNALHDNVFRSNGETLVIESPALATSTNDIEEAY